MLITTTMINHGDPKSQRSTNQGARMTARERRVCEGVEERGKD